MLLIIAIILIVFLYRDNSRNSEEIILLKTKVSWYENEFGSPPEDVDFKNPEFQSLMMHPPLEEKVIDGASGEPIEDVEHWNVMGIVKDTGTFTLSESSLVYVGAKTDLEISTGEVKKVSGDYDQIKIETDKGDIWRFDITELKKAGITEKIISERLQSTAPRSS